MTKRQTKDYVLLTAKGMAMGAADVVPGVSGGTIAFITGIYDELLGSLKKMGPEALKIWYAEGFSAFWQHINGGFLLAVFGGILLSIKTFASVISVALLEHPLLVWSFFSGLILASVVLLVKQQQRWRFVDFISCIIGIAFVVAISISSPTQLSGEWWMMFLGGFVAICAMILPGVSGSFILLLVGLYPIFINAIKDLDLIALASFGGGCICGLMVFSRFLSWLLSRFYQATIALLVGFLIGSLNVTWPWKQTVTSVIDRHGKEVPLVRENVMPEQFTFLTGTEHQLTGVFFAALSGLLLVLLLEFTATKLVKN